MLRAILVLSSALVSIGLVHAFGFWVLLALFGAMLATLIFSTRNVGELPDAQEEPRERHTGYRTTSVAPF